MKSLPNILTSLRLVLALFTFLALAAAAGGVPYVSERLTPLAQFALQRWAVYAFVVAAVTDFFDGWLARKLNATSLWGAILDPIGDKVLVCRRGAGSAFAGTPADGGAAGGSDPVPRVHRQRPARGGCYQGSKPAGHPARQVENYLATGGAGHGADRGYLGCVQPA